MTDDVTALRDALLDDISDPTRFDALPPDRVGHLRDRLDALITAAEARAALTPERLAEALHESGIGCWYDADCGTGFKEGCSGPGDSWHQGQGEGLFAALATDEAVP